MHLSAVHGKLQPLPGLHIIVNLDIGGVPYVIMPAGKGGEFFYHIPVGVHLELIAVPPKVEHPGAPQGRLFHELLRKSHQLRVIVMAGRLQPEPVSRQVEGVAGDDRPAVCQPCLFQTIHSGVAVGAEGVCHSPDNGVELVLQILPVLQQLPHGQILRQPFQKGMGQPMHSHFVPAGGVSLGGLSGGEPAVEGSLRISGPLRREQSAVQIKSTLQAVFIHDIHQPDVLLHAVVIAQGERFCLPLWEAHDES